MSVISWIRENRSASRVTATIRERYESRIVDGGLSSLPNGEGALEYLRRFGKNIGVDKLLGLGHICDSNGHVEMAYVFYRRAWAKDTHGDENNAPSISEYLDALSDAADPVAVTAPMALASSTPQIGPDGLDPALSSFIGRYASPGRARMPILITGPHGTGKSHAAHAFYRANCAAVRDGGFTKMCVITGHAGTETMDILGRTELRGGRTVWRYAGLGEAVALAGRGERVLLFIDELQRIPSRERSVLVSALAPVGGMFRVTSGRALDLDGETAVDEVLEAPVANLSVIATTNLGIEYDVSDVDFAERDRWMRYDFRNTPDSLRAVLATLVAAKQWPKSVTTALVDLWKNGQKEQQGRAIENAPSLRNLVRIVECADTVAEMSIVARHMSSIWVAETAQGLPRAEHRLSVDAILRRFDDRIASIVESMEKQTKPALMVAAKVTVQGGKDDFWKVDEDN